MSQIDPAGVSEYLDREYLRDIGDLKAEFAKIDRTNRNELRQWFVDHEFLRRSDQARVVGVTTSTIRQWRRELGLSTSNGKGFGKRPELVQGPTPPSGYDWTWLRDQYYAGYGIKALARVTGRSATGIAQLFRSHGVRTRTHKEAIKPHPCCTRAWLIEHYCVRGLDRNICAGLAGVGERTIEDWLVKHEIRVRPVGEVILRSRQPNLGAAASPSTPATGHS